MITVGDPTRAHPYAIRGTGSALPAQVITNEQVAAPAGVTGDWVTGRTGIRHRRWAKPDEATSDLAAAAGRAALEDAGLSAADLSLVVVATSTPDSPQPPTAAHVAAALGVPPGTAAFDINAVCSGFVFALAAAGPLCAATGGHALVIGADVYSRILNPEDRRTAVLFGDGAGAVVLGPAAKHGVPAIRLATFADDRELIAVPGGGSRVPTSAESLDAGLHYFTMRGRAVREFVIDVVAPAVRDFLADCAVSPGELAHFVPHQANPLLVADLAQAAGIPSRAVRQTGAEYGNTGAASIPITLDHAARSGALRPGEQILLAGFGGGMSLGLTLLRWADLPARPYR